MYNQVLSNNPGVAATLHGGGANPDFYDQSQNHGPLQAQQHLPRAGRWDRRARDGQRVERRLRRQADDPHVCH